MATMWYNFYCDAIFYVANSTTRVFNAKQLRTGVVGIRHFLTARSDLLPVNSPSTRRQILFTSFEQGGLSFVFLSCF